MFLFTILTSDYLDINLVDCILLFITLSFSLLFLIILHCISGNFVMKRDMLYDVRHKFTAEDSEISALSIPICLNKLHPLLIKTVFFELKL